MATVNTPTQPGYFRVAGRGRQPGILEAGIGFFDGQNIYSPPESAFHTQDDRTPGRFATGADFARDLARREREAYGLTEEQVQALPIIDVLTIKAQRRDNPNVPNVIENISAADARRLGRQIQPQAAPTQQVEEVRFDDPVNAPQVGGRPGAPIAGGQRPEGTRHLGPVEFNNLRKQWRDELIAGGISPADADRAIEANFLARDAVGNIYLKEGAPSIEDVVQNTQRRMRRGEAPDAAVDNAIREESEKTGTDTIRDTDPTKPENSLPPSVADDPAFKALSADMQAALALIHEMQTAGEEEEAARALLAEKALDQAIELAEPIYKHELRVARDDISRNVQSLLRTNREARERFETQIGFLQAEGRIEDAELLLTTRENLDLELDDASARAKFDIERSARRRADAQQDLTEARDFLTIEEAADLARINRRADLELKQTQEALVNKGLTFGSERSEAEAFLAAERQDMVESTQRRNARQIRQLETATDRETREALEAEAERRRQEELQRVALTRQAESRIGSQNLGGRGTGAVGGLRGTLGAEQATRAQRIAELRTAQTSAVATGQERLTEVQRAAERLVGTANLPGVATGIGQTFGITTPQSGLEQQRQQRVLRSFGGQEEIDAAARSRLFGTGTALNTGFAPSA